MIALLFVRLVAVGQSNKSFIVKHFKVEDGLSNNWISAVYQDQNAYLWIATQYGVNRFDGNTFVQFTYNPDPTKGLSGNWIRAITEYKSGQLLFYTYGAGINTFDHYSHQFAAESLKDISSNLIIRKFLALDDGQQLIASNSGLLQRSASDSIEGLSHWDYRWRLRHLTGYG